MGSFPIAHDDPRLLAVGIAAQHLTPRVSDEGRFRRCEARPDALVVGSAPPFFPQGRLRRGEQALHDLLRSPRCVRRWSPRLTPHRKSRTSWSTTALGSGSPRAPVPDGARPPRGSDEYQFTSISCVWRRDDGSVVVGDRGSLEIRVYDADGTFVKSFGGEGTGRASFGTYRTWLRIVAIPS